MVVMGWSFRLGWQLVLEDTMASSSIHQARYLTASAATTQLPVPSPRLRSSAPCRIVREGARPLWLRPWPQALGATKGLAAYGAVIGTSGGVDK